MRPRPTTTTDWIDGRPAGVEALRALALVNYGHFTTLQVRRGAAQGLGLHLHRLRDATHELFMHEPAAEALRRQLRLALQADGRDDCTLRATVFAPGFDPLREAGGAQPQMLVSVAPPLEPVAAPMQLRSFRYRRAAPHIKHVGTFPLFHHRRLAVREGRDDALFVDDRDRVLEGTTWNIGFIEGDGVVWPQGPALRGVTERLLQAGLAEAGIAQATRDTVLDALAGFSAAFACNSRGVRMIAALDGVEFSPAPDWAARLGEALAGQAWRPV